MSDAHAPVIYSRGGYDFRIEVRFLPYPWASYQHWAKVTGAVRHTTPPTELAVDELPFRALEYHGASEADVVDKVRRQIDGWFDAHPGTE